MPRIPIHARASALAAAALLAGPGAGLAQPPRPAAPPPATAAAPRVIYRLELIRTGPLPADYPEKLRPLHTMDAIEKLLKSNDIGFAWRRQDLDSANASPEFVKSLESLPPNEVFAIAQADGVLIGAIVGRRTP